MINRVTDQKANFLAKFVLVTVLIVLLHQSIGHQNSLFVGQTICPVKFLFGLSCPLCGTTRAFIASADFDYLRALYLNPIGISIYMTVVSLPFTFKRIYGALSKDFGKVQIFTVNRKYSIISISLIIVIYTIAKNTLLSI